MTNIVLADDHELMRESIASLLREEPDFNIIGQCSNGCELLKLVECFRPNVVVVDVSMPEINGIEAARLIHKINPFTRIIALSIYTDEAYIRDMITAGASGYVIKSEAAKDLVEAIRLCSRGKVYFSEVIADTLRIIQSNNGKRENFFINQYSRSDSVTEEIYKVLPI
jgi:DNA-binding NarL/FixJ family response regulator